MLRTNPIFYRQALDLWKSVCRMPYSFFLDSCYGHTAGDWSFLGWSPVKIIIQYRDHCRVITAKDSYDDPASIFELATVELEKRRELVPPSSEFNIPFSGGMVGYFGYESANHFSDFSFLTPPETAISVVGFFNHGVAIHQGQKSAWYFENDSSEPAIFPIAFSDITASKFKPGPGKQISPFTSLFSKQTYLPLVKELKDAITNGDIYQANLSHRFSATGEIDPIRFYDALRVTSPAPHAALINLGSGTIFSASPERFFQISDGAITCNPIKGTRPRNLNPDIDAALKNELLNSKKDSAELLMITDLIRNDLGRICETGSISVPNLKQVSSFAQVHHLISTIAGKLRPDITLSSVFQALFPCGSITGAPKIRAAQLIAKLETTPRNIYTGSIGYWSDSGNADFNIAIRTMYGDRNRWYFHAGGGIVADSDPTAEWQETLDKSAGILAAARTYNANVSTPSLRFS